jgi:protein-tyrosine-phosphatase
VPQPDGLAAIASRELSGVIAASAGVVPGSKVAPYAVVAVAEISGADISGHTPRDVSELDLAAFDHVVALDRAVANELRAAPRHGT